MHDAHTCTRSEGSCTRRCAPDHARRSTLVDPCAIYQGITHTLVRSVAPNVPVSYSAADPRLGGSRAYMCPIQMTKVKIFVEAGFPRSQKYHIWSIEGNIRARFAAEIRCSRPSSLGQAWDKVRSTALSTNRSPHLAWALLFESENKTISLIMPRRQGNSAFGFMNYACSRLISTFIGFASKS